MFVAAQQHQQVAIRQVEVEQRPPTGHALLIRQILAMETAVAVESALVAEIDHRMDQGASGIPRD
jgi:hypothetical protein